MMNTNNNPGWLPDGAEIVQESGTMMLIHNDNTPGSEYTIDNGEIVIEAEEEDLYHLHQILSDELKKVGDD